MKLDEIRQKIDKIDRELLVLLQERMGLALRSKKFKQKIADSPYCMDCDQVTETIEHMFLECPKAKNLWEDLRKQFHEKENLDVPQTKEYCIFGIMSPEKTMQRWNIAAIILRWYIYCARIKKKKLSIIAFNALLKCRIIVLQEVKDTYFASLNQNEEDEWTKWTDT